MAQIFIGIDVGGTAVKLGATDGTCRILASRSVSSTRHADFSTFSHAVAGACGALMEETGAKASAIGLATPGYMDPRTGDLLDGGGNIPLLINDNLAAALARLTATDVVTLNDGVAAAMAEWRFGAGRGRRNFAMLTLGTGVGGAIIIDGRPVTGPAGEPPELGAMVLDAKQQPGTLESLAGAPAFVTEYRRAGGTTGIKDVATLFERLTEDRAALLAVDVVASRLAQAIGTLTNALALDGCVIGGGVSAAGAALMQPLLRYLPRFTWPLLFGQLDVRTAELSNMAGAIGAAMTAAERHRGSAAEGRFNPMPTQRSRNEALFEK